MVTQFTGRRGSLGARVRRDTNHVNSTADNVPLQVAINTVSDMTEERI